MTYATAKQICASSLELYLALKRELTNLSTDRLVLRKKMIDFDFNNAGDTPEKQEIILLVKEVDMGIQRLLQKSMRISYYLAAAYGCEFCADGYEDNEAFIAATKRIRNKLFTILGETPIMELPELVLDTTDEFFVDLIDLGNIYSRYFEVHVVEPRLDLIPMKVTAYRKGTIGDTGYDNDRDRPQDFHREAGR